MIETNQVIRIGRFSRTHGKSGELQCQMDNTLWDDAQAEFIVLDIDRILTPYRVDDWRGKGNDSLLFQLSGVNSEEKALSLVGATVYMLQSDVESDAADHPITWQSLTGFRVIDIDQGDLGIVKEVNETTANTLLTLSDGRLIPIHEDFIIDLDTNSHLLHIRLPYQL